MSQFTEAQIKYMVDRFLGWRLPENFNPDGGVSFKKTFNDHLPTPTKHEPMGTNLLDATQADAMVRYMIEGLRSPQDTQLSEQAQWALTELQRKEGLSGCTSYVQRKLQVGYNRACNILEELERAGWITEPDDTGLRQWKRSPQENSDAK